MSVKKKELNKNTSHRSSTEYSIIAKQLLSVMAITDMRQKQNTYVTLPDTCYEGKRINEFKMHLDTHRESK